MTNNKDTKNRPATAVNGVKNNNANSNKKEVFDKKLPVKNPA